jgi:hypothetical protein
VSGWTSHEENEQDYLPPREWPQEQVTGADILDPETSMPRLLSRQCSTCVGRPGNPMYLGPGRLKLLIEQNTGPHHLGLVCHQTLPYGDHPEFGAALCRWFYDTYGHMANGIRVFERLCGFTEVDPPEED